MAEFDPLLISLSLFILVQCIMYYGERLSSMSFLLMYTCNTYVTH